MIEITYHWIISIHPDYYMYGNSYERVVASSNVNNPYRKYIENKGEKEYISFEESIISFCELYGLQYKGCKDSESLNSLSRYYTFYVYDEKNDKLVNLIIEVRVSDHDFLSAKQQVNKAADVAKNVNHDETNIPLIYTINLIFNEEGCHNYEDALLRLQLELKKLDQLFGLMKIKNKRK